MTFAVTPYPNFQSQARAALDFYAAIFGGKTIVMTYGEMGQADHATSLDDVIWGQAESPAGVRVMAYDVQADRDYDAGSNAFFMSVRGTDGDVVRSRWDALAEGATILQPIGPASRSAAYGMLTDRFGVTWIVDVAP